MLPRKKLNSLIYRAESGLTGDWGGGFGRGIGYYGDIYEVVATQAGTEAFDIVVLHVG